MVYWKDSRSWYSQPQGVSSFLGSLPLERRLLEPSFTDAPEDTLLMTPGAASEGDPHPSMHWSTPSPLTLLSSRHLATYSLD